MCAMRRAIVLAGLGALTLVAPSRLEAQALAPGTVVRVRAPQILPSQQVGRVVSWEPDTLVLAPILRPSPSTPAAWVIPREAIEQLEASAGRRGHATAGFAVGAGVGLAVGFIVIKNDAACSGGSTDPLCGPVVAVFTGGGALLGTLFGAILRTDKWESVDVR